MQARGEFITIYDAEDRPEPLQLRRAVVAFSRGEARVACLQAKLEYHNPRQNLLTSWFAIEYLSWFGFALPAIAGGDTPVPLGGTSMHMRRAVLEEIGGWDPFNVTEDCDLGVRLVSHGLPHRVPQLHDVRGGEQRRHQLGEAALSLVQGLRAVVARAHAPSGPPLARARYAGASAASTCWSAQRR